MIGTEAVRVATDSSEIIASSVMALPSCGRSILTADGQRRYQLAGICRVRLAGDPDGRWRRCDQAARREIVQEGETFTVEVAR